MATLPEYAALSAGVYNDQRGGGGSIVDRVNILGVPLGWDQLAADIGFPAQASYDEHTMDFTAGACVNSSTGEIVIAYKGTDTIPELNSRGLDTVNDWVMDINAFLDSFISIAQPGQAATYYEDVRTWAVANGYDPDKISFTGHSLGGGMA